jgi:hypothetical protein
MAQDDGSVYRYEEVCLKEKSSIVKSGEEGAFEIRLKLGEIIQKS